MYTVNRLMRNTLTTPIEALFHAPTKQNVDVRPIESSIIVAEERFIRTELGYDFYEYMVNTKNKTLANSGEVTIAQPLVGATDPVLTVGDIVNAFEYLPQAYQTLWKQHLWKLVSECVIASAFPEAFIQFGAEGAFHTVPPAGLMVTSGLVTPLTSSMKWALDKKILNRISPLLESMHTFICKNKADYPYYKRECPGGCNGDDENVKSKWSGFCLDIYRDLDDSRGDRFKG